MSSTPLELFRTEGTRQTLAPVSEHYVLASSRKCAIVRILTGKPVSSLTHIYLTGN